MFIQQKIVIVCQSSANINNCPIVFGLGRKVYFVSALH